jgi:hypothetical protein
MGIREPWNSGGRPRNAATMDARAGGAVSLVVGRPSSPRMHGRVALARAGLAAMAMPPPLACPRRPERVVVYREGRDGDAGGAGGTVGAARVAWKEGVAQ